MQYIDLYSCRTVQLPSVWLSQKHELAVCSPAPFFCMMIQLTANATAAKSNYQIQRPATYRAPAEGHCAAWRPLTDIFEGLLQARQLLHHPLDHIRGPLRHLLVLVCRLLRAHTSADHGGEPSIALNASVAALR
jgi:hypothetical protein